MTVPPAYNNYSMPPSPKGRIIRHVEGEPSTIIDRGWEIEFLGGIMRSSAETLQTIATESEYMQSDMVDKFRDNIGDSYEVLFQAADLYEPVGPVIRTYGQELEDVKPSLDTHADDCDEKWAEYESLPGSRHGRPVGGLFQPDEGSPEAEQQAEEDQAKKEAYERWHTEAEQFDADYDTWEDAFDTAVNGITDGTADAIEDSIWSDVVDVLKVVGTIVAIAALFTGIGALVWVGVGIGVAATAATAMQMKNGEADWGDLAMSSLGIIPVTKVTKISGATAVGALKGSGKSGALAFVKSMGGPVAREGGPTVRQALFSMTDNGLVQAWRNGGMSSAGRLLATGSAGGRQGLLDDAVRSADELGGLGSTGFRQWQNAARAVNVQAGANGIGTVVSVNSWAGGLGMPNVKLPPSTSLVF